MISDQYELNAFYHWSSVTVLLGYLNHKLLL